MIGSIAHQVLYLVFHCHYGIQNVIVIAVRMHFGLFCFVFCQADHILIQITDGNTCIR